MVYARIADRMAGGPIGPKQRLALLGSVVRAGCSGRAVVGRRPRGGCCFLHCVRSNPNAAVGVIFWLAMMMPMTWSMTDDCSVLL